MNKNLLAVLVVGTVFFVAGCACGKSKKACPMDSMKTEEVVANTEAAIENTEVPVVNAEAPVVNAEMPMVQ